MLLNMKTIRVGKHHIAKVDDADFEAMSQFTWHPHTNVAGDVYARSEVQIEGDRIRFYMHRLILNLTGDERGDHINHDTLDNQRHNLRKATRSENARNSVKRRWSANSPYKGVTRYGKSGWWLAKIAPADASKKTAADMIGIYRTPEEAARAYDKAAIERFGEFASLNFPMKKPE